MFHLNGRLRAKLRQLRPRAADICYPKGIPNRPRDVHGADRAGVPKGTHRVLQPSTCCARQLPPQTPVVIRCSSVDGEAIEILVTALALRFETGFTGRNG